MCEFWNTKPVVFWRLARVFIPLAPGARYNELDPALCFFSGVTLH
jgi:hypothetical protein